MWGQGAVEMAPHEQGLLPGWEGGPAGWQQPESVATPWGLLGVQAVGQGLIVEADHIGTHHRGSDIGTGQLGDAILVGIPVVLAPVTLYIELEALVGLAIEGDSCFP